MGVVASATRLSNGERVAVKVLGELPEANRELMLRRFTREAMLLARVTAHPHIVSLLDHGTLPSGEPCFVMEYVEGTDLERVLARRGSLPWREVVPLARQILEALAAVHDAGVLHRDLKPSNILLTGADRDVIKLADFGVARALDDDATRLTRTGHIVGTPLYMAPEQMLQLPMTPASDLYSFGLVLYEALSGQIPFGRTLKGVRRRLRDPLPPVNSPANRPQLPNILRDVVGEVTQLEPDARPGVREVLEALSAVECAPESDAPTDTTLTSTPRAVVHGGVAEPTHGLLIARLGSRVLRRRPERRKLDQYVRGLGAAMVVENTDWIASLTCDDRDTLEATMEALVDTICVAYGNPLCVWIVVDTRLEPSAAWAFGQLPEQVAALRARLGG
jgi:serine/threonine protein kinase